MLTYRFNKGEGHLGFLELDGELSSDTISKLQEALYVSLNNAEHVIINLSNVTKIDAACTDLLETVHRYAKKLRKVMTVKGLGHQFAGNLQKLSFV